jgi:hypothetical protein
MIAQIGKLEILERIITAIILAKDVPHKDGCLTLRVKLDVQDYLSIHDISFLDEFGS